MNCSCKVVFCTVGVGFPGISLICLYRTMKTTIVRIKDIAIRANVSTGTVDRVLHNRGRVAQEVKEKVLRIIKEMDYEPNLMARALGSNKNFRFAALIPDEQYDAYWSGPKAGVLKACRELKQFGIQVAQYPFNPYDVSAFVDAAEKITEEGVDGIFLSPIFYREVLPFLERWKKENIPFVLFNTQIADHAPLSYIGQDSYQSGMLGAKLMHFGLSVPCTILIAHFDEDAGNAAHLSRKEAGFRNYFTQHHLEESHKVVRADLDSTDQEAFNKHLDSMINEFPDLKGIFVTNSKAFAVATYLEARQLDHIKVIGHDLLPENIKHLESGRISFLINQNPEGQGYWGVHQLANHLVFKKEVPALKYLPLDIVTRENVAYFQDGGARD